MKIRDQPEVSGYTIFCDDIRYEIDGKINYIGCYPSTIFIHASFPFTILRLCFAATLLQRRENFDPNIEIRIFLPGDATDAPSFVAEMKETSEGAIAEQTAKQVEGLPLSDQRIIAMHTRIVATGLTVKEPGMINVRAVRKGELIRLGGIRVVPGQGQASPPPTANPAND